MFTFLFYLILFGAFLSYLYHLAFVKKYHISGKNVVITGGSMGIGKHIAIEAIKRNAATVVILARNESVLKQAKEEIEKHKKSESQKVIAISCDVTNKEQVKASVSEIISQIGCIDFLILNHGTSMPGYFVEQDESAFEKQMNLNYFGCVYVAKAVAPYMLKQGSGHMTFVSSGCGLVSFVGFSSYAPTKYAIRALAECLHNEFQGHNIGVSVVYPPDTDTPGYQTEQLSKPPETHKISQTAGMCTPAQVATKVLDGIIAGKFHITADFITSMLVSCSLGVSPRVWPVLEFILAPILVLVSTYVRWEHDHISKQHMQARLERIRRAMPHHHDDDD